MISGFQTMGEPSERAGQDKGDVAGKGGGRLGRCKAYSFQKSRVKS